MIHIIADSISPQTKAAVASVATGSVGVSTVLEAIPGIIGVIASIVGVIYSTILVISVVTKSRQASEIHKLKVILLKREVDADE